MSSHLVEILLPVRTGNGELVTPARFEELLHERFGVEHTTIQVEHTSDRLLDIASLRSDHTDR